MPAAMKSYIYSLAETETVVKKVDHTTTKLTTGTQVSTQLAVGHVAAKHPKHVHTCTV